MRAVLPGLLLLALVAGGGAATGGAWWLADRVAVAERDEQASQAVQQVLATARAAREAIPRALDPADRLLAQLQARQTALARGDRREAEQIEQALTVQARRGQDGVRLAAVADANGHLTWNSHPNQLPNWVGNLDVFLAYRGGRVATMVSRAPGALGGLLVSRPLLGREGGFGGVALLLLEPSRLSQALPAAVTAEEPVVALYHMDGSLLARGRGPGALALPGQLDPRLQPETGGERHLLAFDPRDQHAIATAAAQVPGHDLVVAATLDDTHGGAAARRLARTGQGLAAAVTLGWLGLLGWSAWRLRGRHPRPVEAAMPQGRGGRHAALVPELVEAMPTASYAALVSAEGEVTITAVSPALERLSGWPPEVFQDLDRWYRCIDWKTYPPGQPLPERLLLEPEAEVEYSLRRSDGRWIWLRESCRVVARDTNGIEVLGVLQDMTREHELARQAEQAHRAAAQGIVAAGLAHDLKQPLQVISFAAQNGLEALASGEGTAEEIRQRFQRVVSQSERAAQIARQLGDFTRLEALPLEPVPLAATVRAAIGEVAQSLQDAGVEVQVRLADNLPPVRGRALMVEQVLVNLCHNARDAMQVRPPGERRLRITAGFRADLDQVEMLVTDSGGGVPAELLERVFEMNFTTKERGKGTGTGLTLCRFIMSRFGGSITLRNVPGGAEARLLFRRSQVQAPLPPAAPPMIPVPVPGPGGAASRASAAG